MSGNEVKDEWKGAIPNVTYKYGGSLKNTAWYVSKENILFTPDHKKKKYVILSFQ